MIILQTIATAVFCGAILGEVIKGNKKRKKQAQCENCMYLMRKGGRGWYTKYYCEKYDGFENPPEYCRSYKPRKDCE